MIVVFLTQWLVDTAQILGCVLDINESVHDGCYNQGNAS